MSHRSSIGVLAAVIFLGACSDAPSQDHVGVETLAVVAPTVLHVSASAGAGAPCTSASPCSLADAVKKVRTINANMQADIQVNLADGTYTLTGPLSLTESSTTHDSGTNGFNIVYQPEPGARPILSGGKRITGWTLANSAKNIWAAPASGLQTRQLYVNGKRAIRARGVDQPDFVQTSTGFISPDLNLVNSKNKNEIEVVARSQSAHFRTTRCPVDSISNHWENVMVRSLPGGNFGGLGAPALADVGKGAAYYVGNFNNDRRSDLLFSYWDTASPPHWHNQVALSNGNGFDPPVEWLLDAGQGTQYYVGDWDGNGTSDILFAYWDNASPRHWHNQVALSNGNGFDWAGDWLPDAGQGTTYYVGDWNGDGKSDLLFAYADGGGHWHNQVALSDFPHSNSFTWAPTLDWLPDAGQGTTYYVGDWDGDPNHRSDLLFAYADGAGHWHNQVALSTGKSFNWAPTLDWLPDAGQGTTYYVGDWNGDHASDLLFAYADGAGHWHNQVALSTGKSFNWAPQLDWLPGVGRSYAYHVGQFSTSGRSDLVFSGNAAAISMQSAKNQCWQNLTSQGDYATEKVDHIENAFESLDSPGEWYLDDSGSVSPGLTPYIYYIPRAGENLSSMPVVAATTQTLLSLQGDVAAGHPIHNVQFKSLTFAYATWLTPNTDGFAEIQAGWTGNANDILTGPTRTPGNVTVSGGQSLRFEGNIFTHLGGVGLNFDSGSQNDVVVGNVFSDISSTAIQIGDVSTTEASKASLTDQTRNNTVQDNYITNAAVEYSGAVGIFLGYSDGAKLLHNEITGLPYSGISIGWGWAAQTATYSKNNVIEANRIHDVMQLLDDGGAIYTLGAQAKSSSIDHNYLYSIGHSGSREAGAVYHDQGSTYYNDAYNVASIALSGPAAWLYMWDDSPIDRANKLNVAIDYNAVSFNDVDIDRATCAKHFGVSSSQCAFLANSITGNTFTGGAAWPGDAQATINASGLESAYAGIKSPVCGDATCNGSETASTCSKDCR